MNFTIEEIYGCNREKYCSETGVTASMLVRMLEAEVFMLESNLKRLRSNIRLSRDTVTDLTRELELYHIIEEKITKKTCKIKDIKKEFLL